MAQVESLTIQILGDSSGLSEELNSVASQLEELQQQLTAALGTSSEFGQSFAGLSAALGPLQAMSGELGLISQELQALSQQPVTLNVQPALESLGQLLQSAQAVASQLAALSATQTRFPLPSGLTGLPTAGPVRESLSPRAFADGGLVTGPDGIDQVPARLSAGEFVLNRDAVSTVGLSALNRMNQGTALPDLAVPDLSRRSLSQMDQSAAVSISQQRRNPFSTSERSAPRTTNQFGGIEIHVRETADVGQVFHDLRRQGIGLRHRRG